MSVAFLTLDKGDAHRCYGNPNFYFGSAPKALLEELNAALNRKRLFKLFQKITEFVDS